MDMENTDQKVQRILRYLDARIAGDDAPPRHREGLILARDVVRLLVPEHLRVQHTVASDSADSTHIGADAPKT